MLYSCPFTLDLSPLIELIGGIYLSKLNFIHPSCILTVLSPTFVKGL